MDIESLIRDATIETDINEFRDKISKGIPLRVKYGIDPTSSHVHLGHTVPLRLLKRFQEAGHEAHLIIGDFTASIGDPSGRNESRPSLTSHQISQNMSSYIGQISKFIDITKTKIWYNSTWLWRMTLADLVKEFSLITLQRMLDRKDFSNRVADHIPVFLSELIYPVVQGIDSREIRADVEIGGSEQLYTLLMARDIQQRAGQSPQSCITVPILRGTDGKKRMGKSLGNFIGINESPSEIFGKTMSIPDEILNEWIELLTDDYIDVKLSPYERKLLLAQSLVSDCYCDFAGREALTMWRRTFSERHDPLEIQEVDINDEMSMDICHLLVTMNLCGSVSEARRLIVPTSGVTFGIERTKVIDPKMLIPLEHGLVVRVGKRRIAKIRLV